MGKKAKKFIDKKSAVTFHVVHRSAQDSEGAALEGGEGGKFFLQPADDRIGPQHLPADFPNEVLHQPFYSSSSSSNNGVSAFWAARAKAAEDANKLDYDYDYSQHLRPMGGGVFIPAKADEEEDLLHVNEKNKLKVKTVDPRYQAPSAKKKSTKAESKEESSVTPASLSLTSDINNSSASTSSSSSSSSFSSTTSSTDSIFSLIGDESDDEDLKSVDKSLVDTIENVRRSELFQKKSAVSGRAAAMFKRRKAPKDFEMTLEDEDENEWEELEDDFVVKAMGGESIEDLKKNSKINNQQENGEEKSEENEEDEEGDDEEEEMEEIDDGEEEEENDESEKKGKKTLESKSKRSTDKKTDELYDDGEEGDSGDEVIVEEREEEDGEEFSGDDGLAEVMKEYESDDWDEDEEEENDEEGEEEEDAIEIDDDDDHQNDTNNDDEKKHSTTDDFLSKKPQKKVKNGVVLRSYDDLIAKIEEVKGKGAGTSELDNGETVEKILETDEEIKEKTKKAMIALHEKEIHQTEEEQEAEDRELNDMFKRKERDQWDAESILSTYSTTENIPKTIPLPAFGNIAAHKKLTKQIKLGKYGIPIGVLPQKLTKKQKLLKEKENQQNQEKRIEKQEIGIEKKSNNEAEKENENNNSEVGDNNQSKKKEKKNIKESSTKNSKKNDSDDDEEDDAGSGSDAGNDGKARDKFESSEEKKKRKAALKAERREKRQQKKTLKTIYAAERHAQSVAVAQSKSKLPPNAVKIL